MKIEDARRLIAGELCEFRVSWERHEGRFLTSDFTPELSEPPLNTLEEAREIAFGLVRLDPLKYVNIFIRPDGHNIGHKINPYPADYRS